VRVAGFSTAFRTVLLPVITGLAASHPQVRVLIREHEPAEALQLLATDRADLALTYGYNLAPAVAGDPAIRSMPLWTARWALGVPARETAARGGTRDTTPEEFARFRAYDWIGNSRNTADEDVIRTMGPQVELRAYAAARHGRLSWPPLALVIRLLQRASRAATPSAEATFR